MSFRSKLTANGRVTVPAAIRRKLGVGPGSVIEWILDGERVIVRKAGKYSSEDFITHCSRRRPSAARSRS